MVTTSGLATRSTGPAGTAVEGMLVIRSPDHVTIAAANAAAAIEFFELLGFRKQHVAMRLRFFEGPEGITLELVQWVDKSSD